MLVKEMIAELQKLDPNKEVIGVENENRDWYEIVAIESAKEDKYVFLNMMYC